MVTSAHGHAIEAAGTWRDDVAVCAVIASAVVPESREPAEVVR